MEESREPRQAPAESVETALKHAPRKFVIEQIETTSRSSRKPSEETSPQSPPFRKRFQPEPIETTRSSNKKSQDESPKSPKAPRRFAPQPIESSSRSSKTSGQKSGGSSTTRRQFLPEPVEISRGTSKSTKENSSKATSPGRFLLQQMENSTEQRRTNETIEKDVPEESREEFRSTPELVVTKLPSRRKFAPDLIDTAKRTRRAGDLRPAHHPSDRTDSMPAGPGSVGRPRRVQLPAEPESLFSGSNLPHPALSSAECRRLGIPIPKRQTSVNSLRQHSFRSPSLEPIDSSGSGEDSDHSSAQSSPSSSSGTSYQAYQHATRLRESIDVSSRGYILELAAKQAQRQLRDQADAAYPNPERHVRVDHYIGHDHEGSTSRSTRSELDPRRFDSVNWELKDMRRHHDSLEASKERDKAAREARRKWNLEYEAKCGAWRNPFKGQTPAHKHHHKDNAEMDRMRKTARPPMLGNDIDFPRCSSPEPARFDVTQGTYNERTAMCYLSEHAGPGPCGEGLWAVKAKKSLGLVTIVSPAHSRNPSPSPSGVAAGGLWGGFCSKSQAGYESPLRGPTGILTPAIMDENAGNSFDAHSLNMHLQGLPPSPPPSNSGVACLDEKLEVEQNIEAEFSDEFITQVYNYLSLGYPSIARKYDEELAKITRASVDDLRHDDDLESSRGYIRFGEDGNNKEEGINEDMCARWKALKAYIHEWARQQPGMQEPKNRYGFGVSVRRGSWAW